jgi:hypothetical protein
MTAFRVLGTVLFLLAIGAADAHGQMFVSTGADTLRGLPGIEVIVDSLQPELESGGLTNAALRADVEGRLRRGGITIYPSQVANPSPAKPYLYIALNALTLPAGAGYALGVQVHLRQTLRSPVTNSNIVNAMTWDIHNVLAVPAAGLQSVRAEVLTFVDQFVEDWTRVH